jgi:hypothetical protein
VAVRDLETHTTTLVSQTLSSLGSTAPEAVSGGAAITPLHDRLEYEGRELSASTAAISAEGNTVAWMGIDIAQQAPAAAGDTGGYDEPLWRQIGEGPNAPTRRVTGGDDPACDCAGPLETEFNSNPGEGNGGPEAGAYVAPGGFGADPLAPIGVPSMDAVTPQLSYDGQEVAILSTQPRTGEVSRTLVEEADHGTANAYVVNMANGLTRAQALTQLTAWANDDFRDAAATGAVDSIAISPDGTRVAFTTSRIEFPLSPPALVTPMLGAAGEPQLYVADLAASTLRLVSYGYDGEAANGRVADPSFTGDGETVAFASSATNLVYGAYNKGNREGEPGNVFLTSEVGSPAVPGVQTVTPLPTTPLVTSSRGLLATARAGVHGTVLVYVTVPGGGTLKASARAEMPVSVTVAAKGGRRRKRTILASRVVATATATAKAAELLELRLASASAYRALVEGHDGLYATISLTFVTAGEATLTSTVQASFHGKISADAKKATKSKKAPKATRSSHDSVKRS